MCTGRRMAQTAAHLADRGIQTNVNYPSILPLVPAYARLGHSPADFPVAYRHQKQILSLPMYSEMTDDMVATVARVVREWADAGSPNVHAHSPRQ